MAYLSADFAFAHLEGSINDENHFGSPWTINWRIASN